ncbi:hypothetical protein [Lacticaseibacillus porcinae]|uniref:hypothetical protein n=1 Tax=Lacticaseibacillus porcinae TaxID=1123687 RepID=UPI000F78EC05|nr:hypothetical protein [Lacticaseibacillus porcinae]
MEKKRTVPWGKLLIGAGILFLVIAVVCYLVLHQRLIGLVAMVIGMFLFDLSLGPRQNRSLWDKYRWLVGLIVVVSYVGLTMFGRHTYTGHITAVTRVEDRHSSHHYAITLKNSKQTYHLEDSRNVFLGKSDYLHLHVSDKRVKVTTSGILPSNFLIQQNILSVK